MSTTRITWQDALLMPEDGNRYEAIDGELYVTPAPSYRHQRVSGKLFRALAGLLEDTGHGWVVVAPVAVQFPETGEGVQPDIVFVSRARAEILAEEGICGAPDLAVEVLSPSTVERDRTVKKKLYERQGVAQYWIVDPDAESVEVWDFESGGSSPEHSSDRLHVRLGGRRFGELDLRRVFARV